VQRCASLNTHGLHFILELILGPILVLIIIIPALSSLLFWLLGLAAAPPSATTVLLAGSTGTILALLLVALLVLLLLLLGKFLHLPALLEIVVLGTVDLAVRPTGLATLVARHSLSAVSASGNLLARAFCLGLLGSVGVTGALDYHH
jgi:hypothetical protein